MPNLTPYRWKSWKEGTPADYDRVYLGDFAPVTSSTVQRPDDYLWIDLCGGSDYSGDSVNVANHRAFLALYGTLDGVHDVYGGHGTYGVVVRRDAITDEMRETFAALDDYPLIDENLHSEIEMDAEHEGWESWAAQDFRRALVEKFPQHEEAIEALDRTELYELFDHLRERANVYWENETGNSAWIDLDRIVLEAAESDLPLATV